MASKSPLERYGIKKRRILINTSYDSSIIGAIPLDAIILRIAGLNEDHPISDPP